MEDKTFELMEKMYAEILGMKSDMKEGFAKVNSRIDGLEKEVSKNTISLENLEDKVKVIAECQVAFGEQLERSRQDNEKAINDRFDLVELAITSNSKDYTTVKNVLRAVSDSIDM